ncbi:hypothetical protein VTO42DRAFT_3848 [Malbranchea cinnamomea]
MTGVVSAGLSQSPESFPETTSFQCASQNVGDSEGSHAPSERPDDATKSASAASIGDEVLSPRSPEDQRGRAGHSRTTASSRRRETGNASALRRRSLASHLPGNVDFLERMEKDDRKASTADVSTKLGTLSGVFVPTTLNVLSILMFLRFGFILGQSGVLGMMGMLVSAYLIDTLTTMSISAIATNGTVRGGGAYYLISRSLGPEFGGSIGIVLYLGFVFNTGMNAVGLVNCLTQSFGVRSGIWAQFLFEGFWWQYLWGTTVLVMCTGICLAGSSIFARASNGLLVVLLVATFSIPLSAAIKRPFSSERLGIEFTGLSWDTFVDNLKPRLTQGAAGSQIPGKENFQNLFGILFPATSGIFAGTSMSGDLRNPSKSIPKGTLCGLGTTFFTYSMVILAVAATVTRESLYRDVNIIQDINISGLLVVLGEFSTTFFSSLMGVVGAAKLLEAVAKDNIIPGLSIFGTARGKPGGEPVNAILFTFVIAQFTMLFDINRIASFITMTYLMTFLVTNLACFLLKVGSAPNFRPSFHYFNSWTALAGTIISGGSMFFVDGIYATGCVCILVLLFLIIHYTTPPKSWGDVSQSLIYHQVRKYLLRLKPEHVKFWRPQILLFVNDFETQYKMIHFCNSLKKGALFVLGRVIVSQDFANTVPEVRREQAAWTKFIEFSKVKAFINISVGPTVEWGIRNIVLNSGLGGMRPNIVVIGQYRKDNAELSPIDPAHQYASIRGLPHARYQPGDESGKPRDASTAPPPPPPPPPPMDVQSYLTVLEDLLFKLRINVAVARGFENLELPNPHGRNAKTHIDLWPIQMSAEISADGLCNNRNLLTTNFDTYTLILQLGCILHTVPSWKKSYKLRVAVFVEYETDVEQERGRVETLLEKLRIEAEVLVFWLASGDLQSYRVIVNGEQAVVDEDYVKRVDAVLADEDWWQEIKSFRYGVIKSKNKLLPAPRLLQDTPTWPNSSFQHGQQSRNGKRFDRLRRIMESSRRRKSISSLGSRNVSFGMQTHRLLDSMVDYSPDSSDESTDEDSDIEPYMSDGEDETGPLGSHSDSSRNSVGATESGGQECGTRRKQRLPKLTPERRTASDTAVTGDDAEVSPSDPARPMITSTADETGDQRERINAPSVNKLPVSRVASSARFSSSPIPETKVAAEEDTGPSIMFAESPPRSEPSGPGESIYRRAAATSSSSLAPDSSVRMENPASGYPAQASVPLSFNDLPCRAQHLILNELIKKHSEQTAVVFTTLPSPIEGTRHDRKASESFVSDLEVLCDGLPPCLLVHSNSVTVTMNL